MAGENSGSGGSGERVACKVSEAPERTGSSTVAIAAARGRRNPQGTRVKVNAAKRWTNHVAMNYDFARTGMPKSQGSDPPFYGDPMAVPVAAKREK
jgi:hypothetical protein